MFVVSVLLVFAAAFYIIYIAPEQQRTERIWKDAVRIAKKFGNVDLALVVFPYNIDGSKGEKYVLFPYDPYRDDFQSLYGRQYEYYTFWDTGNPKLRKEADRDIKSLQEAWGKPFNEVRSYISFEEFYNLSKNKMKEQPEMELTNTADL